MPSGGSGREGTTGPEKGGATEEDGPLEPQLPRPAMAAYTTAPRRRRVPARRRI